jgi:hypothetical protein
VYQWYSVFFCLENVRLRIYQSTINNSKRYLIPSTTLANNCACHDNRSMSQVYTWSHLPITKSKTQSGASEHSTHTQGADSYAPLDLDRERRRRSRDPDFERRWDLDRERRPRRSRDLDLERRWSRDLELARRPRRSRDVDLEIDRPRR